MKGSPAPVRNTLLRVSALALFLLHVPALAMAGSMAYDNLCASPPAIEAALIVGLLALLVGSQCKAVCDGMKIMAYLIGAAAVAGLFLLQLPAISFLYAMVYDSIPEDLQPTGPGSTIVLLSVMSAIVLVNMSLAQRFEFMEYMEQQEESLPEIEVPTGSWPFVAVPQNDAALQKVAAKSKRTAVQEMTLRVKNSYSKSLLGPRSGNPLYQQWYY
jgi:hypothetical protein